MPIFSVDQLVFQHEAVQKPYSAHLELLKTQSLYCNEAKSMILPHRMVYRKFWYIGITENRKTHTDISLLN